MKNWQPRTSDRILDIGGSSKQRQGVVVDTLVDLHRPENDAYWPSKLQAKHFVKVDICREKLPFADKEFDFCFCTHTLEDLYNPFLVIDEMSRVAKRGLIITPSRGADMVFSHFDLTDWRTGPRRVPGQAHHKWFFENKSGTMVITPKNYPLLYTPEFHVAGWTGEPEFVYFWDGAIKYRVFDSIFFHGLIKNYREFTRANRKNLFFSPTLFYLDNPLIMVRELFKLILKRGTGFKFND